MNRKCLKLTFEFDTALHIGSGTLAPETGSSEVLQNGAGEYLIPGSTFAGLFFERLARLKGHNSEEYAKLQGSRQVEKNEQRRATHASPLIFRSATLANANLMVRDHVKIDRRLKSAEDGKKFAHWQISPHWDGKPLQVETMLELDLNSYQEDFLNPRGVNIKKADIPQTDQLLDTVCEVLGSWAHEGLFIGAHASSGMGWAHLVDAVLPAGTPDLPKPTKKVFKKWKVELKVGDEPDGYGTNALLIRAGEGEISYRLVIDENADIDPFLDAVFLHDGQKLLIPGSSLKGALSFYVEKYHGKDGWLRDLLGQEGETAGRIFFSDLYAVDFQPKHLLTIERHAEDEFTRAIITQAKFNEERLFRTAFLGEIRAYADDPQLSDIESFVTFFNDLAAKRLFSLGAQACHPEVFITPLED